MVFEFVLTVGLVIGSHYLFTITSFTYIHILIGIFFLLGTIVFNTLFIRVTAFARFDRTVFHLSRTNMLRVIEAVLFYTFATLLVITMADSNGSFSGVGFILAWLFSFGGQSMISVYDKTLQQQHGNDKGEFNKKEFHWKNFFIIVFICLSVYALFMYLLYLNGSIPTILFKH